MFDIPNIEQVAEAIQCIPADVRDICVKVGQAIHNEYGEAGFLVWIAWLQTGQGYNYKDMLAVWRSFTAGAGITIATLFYMAKQNGYIPSINRKRLSQEEINARNVERQARHLKAEQAQARKKYYAEKRLNKLLSELQLSGDPSAQYFFNRGLGLFRTPESVMFHPAMEYWEDGTLVEKYPAVVSLVTDADNNLVTFHIIYLTNNGKKAPVNSPKKILTPITTISGASVKFAWPDDELYLSEGIETGLAVMLSTSKPVWACLSTHGLETVIIPQSVKTVYIMADKDRSGAGKKSANKLAQRLIKKGFTVHILLPKQPIPAGSKGIDWLDIYKMEQTV